jgi:hypothetical protein
MDGGLGYYLTNENLGLWRLLDAVVGTLPDQGIDRKSDSNKGTKRRHDDEEDNTGPAREPSPLKRKPNVGKPNKRLKQCLVCRKRHDPFCPMPECHRRQMKAKAKQRAATAKAEADRKDQQGS